MIALTISQIHRMKPNQILIVNDKQQGLRVFHLVRIYLKTLTRCILTFYEKDVAHLVQEELKPV